MKVVASAVPAEDARVARYCAFTLIELLVVIGILVILIAILLPSLSKARAAGRTAVCLAHEHGLGQALQTYYAEFGVKVLLTKSDSHNFFDWDYMLFGAGMSGDEYNAKPSLTIAGNKLIICPDTEPQPPNLPRVGRSGTAHMQWSYDRNGSYAINSWLYDRVAQPSDASRMYRDPVSLRSGSTIPVFLDGTTNYVISKEDCPVPTNLEDPVSGSTIGTLTADCINRHVMAINVSFFDGHAETVKLPNLWTLKWAADWSRTEPAVVPGK